MIASIGAGGTLSVCFTAGHYISGGVKAGDFYVCKIFIFGEMGIRENRRLAALLRLNSAGLYVHGGKPEEVSGNAGNRKSVMEGAGRLV